MALPTASDNPFPSLLITEGTEPSAPAAGKQRLYIDSTSHHLKRTDSSGTDVDIESAAANGLATDTLWDAKGDRVLGTGANTAAKKAAPTNGKLMVADSAQSDGWRDTFGLYFSRRVLGGPFTLADTTLNVNSTTYTGTSMTLFDHDWDQFPATHFAITVYGFANEASQTIKLQLAAAAAAATAYSAGGDDVTVTNNSSTSQRVTSGWVAVAAGHSGIISMVIAVKGSTATVDLSGRWMDIAFKIA